ncbi:MAG: hypothetical protein JO048_09905 [Methylobacteriaceae bacterium]|nr:hypothetical protein [Methylobacteriaceae bacterium]
MVRRLGALLVAAGLLFATAPAPARAGEGAAIAAGALGGLALGTVLGSAAASGPYYPGKPVYRAPPPPEYLPPPPRPVRVYEEVESRCYWTRRRFVDPYGDVVVRRERWCD